MVYSNVSLCEVVPQDSYFLRVNVTFHLLYYSTVDIDFFCNLIKCLTILFIEHSIQQSFSIIRVGLSVLTSVQGSNLGMLELTYQLQTFRDYSFSSQIPYRKQNNSIINKKCQQVHSKYDNCGFLDQACQKCPIDLKLGMMIPDTVWYSNSLILRYLCPF